MSLEGQLGRGLLAGAVLGLIFSATLADSPTADAPLSKDTTQRFATIESGGRVRVVNPFGNVYARFGGYELQVEVMATMQRLDHDTPELDVRLTRNGPGVDVVVGRKGADGVSERGSGQRDRADLVVFVPNGSTLDAETREDLIEISGIKGDVYASSLKGDVRIRSTRGLVRAKSARGQVTVTLETGVTPEPQELTTEIGDIEVYLWEDADLNVDLATSGEISTDFSLQIEHRRFEEPGKHAVAVVGDGGPRLSLRSKRGRIRLLRLPKELVPTQ